MEREQMLILALQLHVEEPEAFVSRILAEHGPFVGQMAFLFQCLKHLGEKSHRLELKVKILETRNKELRLLRKFGHRSKLKTAKKR